MSKTPGLVASSAFSRSAASISWSTSLRAELDVDRVAGDEECRAEGELDHVGNRGRVCVASVLDLGGADRARIAATGSRC